MMHSEADHTHVEGREAAEANLQPAGPELVHEDTAWEKDHQSWAPTRKWWAAFSGAVASILANVIESGEFDQTERGMLATAIVALTAAYWQRNKDDA